MAASAVIGALRVVLGADTASFETGLQKAKAEAQRFGTSVAAIAKGTAIGTQISKGIDLASQAFREGVKDALEYADNIQKASQKIGVSTEELSSLTLAAKLSDVSFENLTKGLGNLAAQMTKIAKGGSSEATDAFTQLGIQIKDANGELRPTSAVLADLAEKFSELKDGTGKTGAAAEIFGKKIGKDLIPLLNGGRDEIERWTKAAQAMGLQVSDQLGPQAERFNDNLTVIQQGFRGLAIQAVQYALPAMVRLSDGFARSVEKGDLLTASLGSLQNAIKEVTVFFFQAVKANEVLGKAVGLTLSAVQEFAKLGVFGDASKKWEEAKQIFSEFGATMGTVRDETTQLFTKITVGGKQAKEAFDPKPAFDFAKAIEDLQFKTAEVAGTFNKLPEGFAELAKGQLTVEQLKGGVASLNGEWSNLALKVAEYNAQKAIAESKPQFVQDQLALDRLQLSFDLLKEKGLVTADEIGKAMQAAAQKTASYWQKGVGEALSATSQGLQNLAGVSKEFAVAAKVAAIAEATFNTYVAATKALATYPPPLSYAAAAAAVVAGLGYVAKISAQGFKTGGSFTVGGTGGQDSQLVQFMASPGEMVDVRKPGDGNSSSSSSRPQEVVLSGRSLGDLITLDDVRTIVEKLNRGGRDGYRLKVRTAR